MELLDNRLEELNSALDYISENAKKYLNADVEKYILDIENPEITLKQLKIKNRVVANL